MRLGVDLDNTIVDYDRLFVALAARAGHVVDGGKTEVREALRRGADGDRGWQRLQAQAYGPQMQRAVPFDGVRDVLAELAGRGVELWIISHKTRFAAIAPDGADLRQAAMAWLIARGFFRADTGLTPARVLFCDSRAEKLSQIRRTGCSHFVDDLVEMFQEPGFPAGVGRLLFDPAGLAPGGPWRRFSDWHQIGGHLLDARAA